MLGLTSRLYGLLPTVPWSAMRVICFHILYQLRATTTGNLFI